MVKREKVVKSEGGDKQRGRGNNVAPSEEQLLPKLAIQHRSIIECKITDALTNEAEEQAWDAIAGQYNAACPVKVSVNFNVCVVYEC